MYFMKNMYNQKMYFGKLINKSNIDKFILRDYIRLWRLNEWTDYNYYQVINNSIQIARRMTSDTFFRYPCYQ